MSRWRMHFVSLIAALLQSAAPAVAPGVCPVAVCPRLPRRPQLPNPLPLPLPPPLLLPSYTAWRLK